MIKNMIHLQCKPSERVYEFICSQDSPLGEIHDVLCQMKSEIVKRISESNVDPKEKEKSDHG